MRSTNIHPEDLFFCFFFGGGGQKNNEKTKHKGKKMAILVCVSWTTVPIQIREMLYNDVVVIIFRGLWWW